MSVCYGCPAQTQMTGYKRLIINNESADERVNEWRPNTQV